MPSLSYPQQKELLKRHNFTLTTNGRRMSGRLVGFDHDRRGFGGVVVFPNGTRVFWGVNPNTMALVDLGTPPQPRRKY